MAILPINLTVVPTWKDITASVLLLELIEEETVEIYHDGQGLIEVIIDTLGTTTIDSTYDKKGRLINGSQFLAFPYTPTTKFWVRRVKSTLKPISQIQIRKPLDNVNINGVGKTLENLNVSIKDGNGNPLSSYYNETTDTYVLNVHDADVHNRPVNQYFHQHTGITTTLTTATLADGSTYIIDVASTVGFVVADHVQIDADNHQGIKYQILALTATTMTLDSYVDSVFPIGAIVAAVEIEMNVLGTIATPEEFIIRPNPGQIIHITRILITMTHGTAGDLGLFGNLAPLTNGVLLRANVNDQYGTFTNWKTNENMKSDMYDVDFNTRSGGGGTYGTSGRGSFSRIGVALRLDGKNGAVDGDFLELYIRDDLTGLLTFEIKAQGHIEGA